ncbi:phosphate regulon sensor kinase PhoR [Burkholderiales bacterium JOSHI_001]|nr:phosphate regulon sensor kinase PhoR [Burkholderiales bacterium JOSHI_001]
MNWFLSRWLKLCLGAVLGVLAGAWLGSVLQLPGVGMAAGAALGLGLVTLADLRRARQVLRWLRDRPDEAGPRPGGLWGELAYRAEKVFRQRSHELAAERQNHAQFLAAIDASPNGVLLLDEHQHIEWCNAVAALHLGLDAQRDRGQAVTNLVRAPGFVAQLQGADFDNAITLSLPGRDLTLQVLVRRYGQQRSLVLTQDVTERLRSEAMRRDFVANVSHEIRSPLTVLAGFVETMATLKLSETERQRVLQLMQQQTDRMQTLVADLLTLAQLEGSPRPPTDRWVPLAALLARVRAEAQALSGGRHQIDIDSDSGEGLALAGSDSELYSAIANLVSNAVRYTPAGGHISARWLVRQDGGMLEVADTGIGIAREHLPRLAERFYRVDGSRSRDTGGTGLGLAIAKHAIQRHGGELDVDSEPGKGSRFRLLLPAARIRRDGVPSDQPAPVLH